jgi:hypothetical protein
VETETPTPTLTLTPTPTYTPTLIYSTETAFDGGHGARFERTVTAGDYSVTVLLFLILISIWGMWFFNYLREWRGNRP